MKPRTKFLVGAGLVLATRLAADTSLRGVGPRLGARVVPGSIKREAGGRASRYENAPEKYRDTPGYKAATRA